MKFSERGQENEVNEIQVSVIWWRMYASLYMVVIASGNGLVPSH